MKTLAPTAVREIAAALDSLHLKGATKEIRCLDSPILSIAVTMNKATASIQAQRDCGGSSAPAADRVFEIGKLLDRIVGVEPWVGTPQARSQ
jgi:hypothetical protein